MRAASALAIAPPLTDANFESCQIQTPSIQQCIARPVASGVVNSFGYQDYNSCFSLYWQWTVIMGTQWSTGTDGSARRAPQKSTPQRPHSRIRVPFTHTRFLQQNES